MAVLRQTILQKPAVSLQKAVAARGLTLHHAARGANRAMSRKVIESGELLRSWLVSWRRVNAAVPSHQSWWAWSIGRHKLVKSNAMCVRPVWARFQSPAPNSANPG